MDYEANYNFLVKELLEKGYRIEHRPVIVKNTEKKIGSFSGVDNDGKKSQNESAHEKKKKRNREYAKTYKHKRGRCLDCGLEDIMRNLSKHRLAMKHKRIELIERERGAPIKNEKVEQEQTDPEHRSLLRRIEEGVRDSNN